MNFNVDDPLADLLSDNSLEIDNFFDSTTSTGAKKLLKSTKSKSKMEDLFGIQEENETDLNATPDMLLSQPLATSTPRVIKHKPEDVDDVDDDLGFDPKKLKDGTTKKNLLADLLSTMETKRPATAAPAKATISRQSTDTTTDNSNILTSQTRPKTSTGRRSSAQSATVNTDPLGLFTREKENNATISGMSTPTSKRRAATADWLGLGAETTLTFETSTAQQQQTIVPKSPKHEKTNAPTVKEDVDILRITHSQDAAPADQERKMEVTPAKTPLSDNTTAQNMLLLNSLNLGAKNTFTVLNQQENQLEIATQMKNQERVLFEMQQKQELLLQKQESHFLALLQQQLQRQHKMEEHIKQQQLRINTHLQLLMTQPAYTAESVSPIKQAVTATADVGTLKANATEAVSTSQLSTVENDHMVKLILQLESDLKRMELEKNRLEELTANMKVSYEQEFEMIANSYKKQIKVLEEHLVAVEERLKQENDELKAHYARKLENMEQELQKLKTEYETELATLKQDHEDEMRKQRKTHEDDIDVLKEEYRRMLDTIRQSKLMEFAAVQENGNYLETLKLASNNLENLNGELRDLRDNVQGKLESLHKERELKLDIRERRIEDAERRLKMNEETAEAEKTRLMELVSALELQLSRLSKEAGEENWQLRQRMASLEAEKVAFEREKEFHREQLARDEKRIEELKTQQLDETKRITAELQEERAHIVLERSKIEMERKLHLQTDLDKDRLELEAQLKVTHDSIRRADEERERYHKMQRELEMYKRQLIDKENTLNAKEDQLTMEINAYRKSEARTQAMEQKARQGEQMLQAKLLLLNKRMLDLSKKEEQLSQQRMQLAQERIALHNLKLRLSQSKCTLCKMSAENSEFKQLLCRNLPLTNDEVPEIGITQNWIADTLRFEPTDIVDRMLDENIASSYKRMYNTAVPINNEYWTAAVMDDDAKKLALDNSTRELVHEDLPS